MKKIFCLNIAAALLFFSCQNIMAVTNFPTLDNMGANEKLIISNYPERILGPGKIFEETMSEKDLRIVYYHINKLKKDMYINISIKNISDKKAKIKLFKGFGGPNVDGIFSGHKATKSFFSNLVKDNFQYITLKPGEAKQIVWHVLKPKQVSTGIVKINSINNQELKVKMQVIDPEYLSVSGFDHDGEYSYAYLDSAVKNLSFRFDCEKPLQEIPIGDIPYIKDTIRDIEVRGNYGLTYFLDVVLVNNNPWYKKVDLYFSPYGGVVRGLVLIENKFLETGFFRLSTNLVPEKIYEIVLKPNEEKRILLATMPQPGSFYPISLVFQSNAHKLAFDQ
jgi:hypothetical protein